MKIFNELSQTPTPIINPKKEPVMTTNPFTSAFNQLIVQAKTDALVPFNTASDNIIATPTTQNVVLQGAQFWASLIPLLPLLEGQGIKDVFTAFKTAVNTPAAPVIPTTPPAA